MNCAFIIGLTGRDLELQWRFALHLACVKQDPERFLQRLDVIRLAGTHVRSLPLEVYFLILSLHGTKHNWRQLKLICDIAEILRSEKVDWEHELCEADDLGLNRMLAVATLLAICSERWFPPTGPGTEVRSHRQGFG